MQDDDWAPCTGFFLVRPEFFSKQVIDKSIKWLKSHTGFPNDQHAFQNSCKSTPIIKITTLSREEYPNGKIYFNQKIQDKARMVHSNFLRTTDEKVQRFKEYDMWDESDVAFNLVNKYTI
jgi:hypothetical protein